MQMALSNRGGGGRGATADTGGRAGKGPSRRFTPQTDYRKVNASAVMF